MDNATVNKVCIIKTTCSIEVECSCGGKFIKVYGKTDSKTNRQMYRCNKCKDEVYLDSTYEPITVESSEKKIIGTETIYIDKPYTCSCGGMILYIGNRPGKCMKCNKTYEV